jgi:hypothetical protein
MGATLHLHIFHLLPGTYNSHSFYSRRSVVVLGNNFHVRLPRNNNIQNIPKFRGHKEYRPADMVALCTVLHNVP